MLDYLPLETLTLPVLRDIVLSRSGKDTLLRVSLPLPLLIACFGARQNSDVAVSVLAERLEAPICLNLDALDSAMPSFRPMLDHAMTVKTLSGVPLELKDLKLRLQTPIAGDIMTGQGAQNMGDLRADACFLAPSNSIISVSFTEIPMPKGYHLVTEIQDLRPSRPKLGRRLGPLVAPLRFARDADLDLI
ncbi:MAG: hypothetical protein ACPGNV_08695 [Mangrovicoccus sp.]